MKKKVMQVNEIDFINLSDLVIVEPKNNSSEAIELAEYTKSILNNKELLKKMLGK